VGPNRRKFTRESDYVIVDTRVGFSFESTDLCALADRFLAVIEADPTSFYQTRNLMRRIDEAAGESGSKPILRGVLVNKRGHFRVKERQVWPPRYQEMRKCAPFPLRSRRRGTLAVYDCVGFVKAILTALGRENCVEMRLRGEAGVKGAFFAFISTLDTGLSPLPQLDWDESQGSF